MNTDLLNILCADYLSKLEQGKLEPAEQGMAATVLGDMIRRLRNTLSAYQGPPDDSPKVSER